MVVWSRFTTCLHGMTVIAGSPLLHRRDGGHDSLIVNAPQRDERMNKLFSRTHVGPAHPANTGGVTPVAPSALRSFEHAAIRDGDGNITEAELVVPRALELNEIAGIVEQETSASDVTSKDMRRIYQGTIIAAGGFTGESAEQIVVGGHADLVAFGRMFISNPDLPERLRAGKPLTRHDRSTFYGGDARGYTDYASHSEVVAA